MRKWAKGSEPGPCAASRQGPRLKRASFQLGSGPLARQVGGSTESDCLFQDSDLKQYLDHCGNLMSMHNVKVRASKVGTSSWQPSVIKASVGCSSSHQLLRLLGASNTGRRERPLG